MPHVHVHSHLLIAQLKSLVSALYNSGVEKTKHFFKGGTFFWLEDHRKALGERSGEVTEGSDGDDSKNEVSVHIP